ncbi:MAG: NusG domain II-containing protein [Collinsella intestinalis]
MKHRLKTGDLCLIAALLLALVGGGAWWLINYANGRNTSANGPVVVTQSKDGFRRVDELARDATFTVETNGTDSGRDADGGENVISISEGRVEVKSANCGNQVCVEHAPISQAGDSRMSSHGLVVELLRKNRTPPPYGSLPALQSVN